MKIQTYVANSCAVAAIADIGSHKNPEEVFRLVCREILGHPKQAFFVDYGILHNFYVFCAGPEVKKTDPGGSHHSKDHWPRYGTEFAEFIKTNGFGDIVTLGPKLNAKHHPDTTAQVWVWSPNQKAVLAWWKKEVKGVE